MHKADNVQVIEYLMYHFLFYMYFISDISTQNRLFHTFLFHLQTLKIGRIWKSEISGMFSDWQPSLK